MNTRFTPPPENRTASPFSQSPEQTTALGRLQNRLGIGRREQLIIGIVLSVAMLAGFLFLLRPDQVVTPPQSSFEPLETHQGTIEVTFQGSYEVPKERVSIFTVETFMTQERLGQYFAEQLDLAPAQYSLTGNTYISTTGGPETLSIIAGNQGYTYTTNTLLTPSMPLANQNEAQNVAELFLSRIGYSTAELTFRENETRFFFVTAEESGEHLEETTAAQAQIIELHYTKTLDSLPLTYSSSSVQDIIVEVTANGVYRAVLPNTFFTVIPDREYRVLSVEQALSNIRAGQFSITGTTNRVQKEDAFTHFTLETQTLQYRFDPNSQKILPVFEFTGTAETESYLQTPISVITEALRVQDSPENGTVETPLPTSQPE